MKKSRNIIELLTLLRGYVVKHIKEANGMCVCVGWMYNNNVIDQKEYFTLNNYLLFHDPLNVHKPTTYQKRNVIKPPAYWWPMKELVPRYQWLTRKIAIEKKKLKQ